MTYARDVVALARKDLLLELRARETLPAMLLFVLATLVAFRFALPSDASERASIGLLWVAILFTALLGITRAFIPEREQRVLDGLVLSPSTAARSGSGRSWRRWRSSAPRSSSRSRPSRSSSTPSAGRTVAAVVLADIGICAVGAILAAMAAAGRARELLFPVLFLPLSIPILVGGVGAAVGDDPARYLAFLALYDAVFAILAWASFEYVVTE